MRATLVSEWTKLRTQRGVLIAVASMCVLMVGMSTLAASEQETDAVLGGNDDVVQIGLAGAVFAALAAVVAGASPMTSEYSTGMIRTTLTATQGRLRVLAAKSVVLALVAFPLALGASVAAFLIAQPLLHERGYALPAYPPVSITDPSAARAVVGTALLLTAYCLIALGIGTVLRHPGASIAAGIGLVFVPLLMLGAFPEHIQERIVQVTPLAGMAVQSTTGRMLSMYAGDDWGMPIGPWQGLGVAYAWAVGALVVGYAFLRRRDA
ncbi:MAG TPA: ABC transporter permease subunit [Gaiella sp.]|uniref:ABC transporter permease subunit n=1 Tax=Gaiella sp. TaxID=2663207 RepID=UPI002D806CC2|nr:ABC transporter permease subunit [Gaiella sp.]HET9286496.1 ABC transporter permease subunit [Gaiella sp.]